MNAALPKFVGREVELEDFQTILASRDAGASFLYLQGDGGTGKTKLLEQFRSICLSSNQIRSTTIIDFYDTDNQTVGGLMNRVATELSLIVASLRSSSHQPTSLFEHYHQAYARTQELRQLNANPQEVSSFEQRLSELFLQDFNATAEGCAAEDLRLVLFFDTLEAIKDFGDVNRWFLYSFLSGIRNAVIVFAGRNKLPIDLNLIPMIREVDDFSPTEIGEYFEIQNIRSNWQSSALIDRVHALTKGNPLLVALAADWLSEHPERPADALLGGQSESADDALKTEFRQHLIGDVLRLELPDEYEAVWYMSHIYHRFNADILCWITGRPKEEASAIIASLARFPYIKYRAKSQSYQLHDVMRELVTKYVLDQVEDIDRRLRRDLSRDMIEYYETRIGESDGAEKAHNAFVMRAEQLYHSLYVDPNVGFDQFSELSQTADREGNVPFIDLLLGNAKGYYQGFTAEQKAVYDVYSAWLTKREGNPAQAEGMLRSSLKVLAERGNPIADEVANSLGHTYKELGRFSDAQAMYKEALRLNEASPKDPVRRRATEATILNNMGNLLRLQGLVDEAHQFAINSLMLRRRLNDPEALANSYYVLGLIVREYGDNNGALRYLDKAEKEYSRLESEFGRRRGLGNVTRARAYICNHVREHEKAVELARESYRMLSEVLSPPHTELADSLDVLGRLLRDKAEDDYQRDRVADEHSAGDRRDGALWEAEEYITLGYQMAMASKDKFKEAESILSYVRLFNVRGNYRESLNWYKRGTEICQPRKYYLLLSYYEAFAGSAYFALGDFDRAFERFGWRALYASQCRAMELGMTIDSIAGYLERVEDPKARSKYADLLLEVWENQPDWLLNQRFPQILRLCYDIRRFAEL